MSPILPRHLKGYPPPPIPLFGLGVGKEQGITFHKPSRQKDPSVVQYFHLIVRLRLATEKNKNISLYLPLSINLPRKTLSLSNLIHFFMSFGFLLWPLSHNGQGQEAPRVSMFDLVNTLIGTSFFDASEWPPAVCQGCSLHLQGSQISCTLRLMNKCNLVNRKLPNIVTKTVHLHKPKEKE